MYGSACRKGFSLLEFCVVLALTSLLLPLLLESYGVCLRYFEHMRRHGREVQERIWLRHFILEQSRRAGMTACGGVGLLRGASHKALVPVSLTNNSLWFRHASAYRQLEEVPEGNTIHLKANTGYRSGQSIVLSDCFHREMHRIQSRQSGTLLLHDRVQTTLQAPVFVAAWEEYALVYETVPGKKNWQLFLQHHGHREPLFTVERIKMRVDSPQDRASIWVSVRWSDTVSLDERFYVIHT